MSWIPYRSSITSGDILRPMINICRVTLGQMVNFTALRYPDITGYTMQHYNQGNIVTPQTNAIVKTVVINRMTPSQLSGSNIPKGLGGAVVNNPY